MKVTEKNFKKLAGLKSTFRVPAFQRQYSWRVREFTQLWDDLQSVLEGTRKKHFMGTVVLKPEDGVALSVIDGQQRLATFTIILKVLHELSLEYELSQKSEIEKLLFRDKRLILNASFYDRDAFNTLLENPSLLRSKKEHKNVKDCYSYFLSTLRTYIEGSTGHRKTNFSKVFRATTEQMAFVEILLGEDDDIHAIFETINYAGMPLTSADLARNFILSQAKTEEEQKRLFKEYWSPLEEKIRGNLIGNSKKIRDAEFQKVLPEFLRAVLVVEKQKYISSTDLFGQLRLYFKDGQIEEKIKLISMHALEYCKFLNPDNEKHSTIKNQLVRILELRMTTFNPILLVLFGSYSKGNLNVPDLKQAMQYIESFLVRRAFNSKVSRDLGQVFARIASTLSAAKPRANLLKVLVDELKRAKWPTDEEFKPCFVSSPIYTNAPVMARFALISLEKNRPTCVDLALGSTVQIEHIFPQSAETGEWPSQDMSDLKKRLHVMGNLTLTQVNQKLGRRGFLDKKLGKGHAYKNSAYWLTKTFMKSTKWDAAEVDKRGNNLLKSALKIWPYPV